MDAAEFSQQTGIYPVSLPTPFIVGPVNCFLLKQDDAPLTLIDTGVKSDKSGAALVAGLAELGVTIENLERVILTHHHIDHCGMLREIMDRSGAESWAHPEVIAESHLNDGPQEEANRKTFYLDIMREFGADEKTCEESMQLWNSFRDLLDPFTINHTIEDGGQVGPFNAYYVPGHSATDTLLVNTVDGYTIAGDHILETFNPNPLLRRPRPGEPRVKALVEYRASLLRSQSLELGRCFPGHGDAFDDPDRVIKGILDIHDERSAKILEIITPDGMTPFELIKVFFPTIPVKHLYLGLSVAVGQLELLEVEGKLRAEHVGGVQYFYPVN